MFLLKQVNNLTMLIVILIITKQVYKTMLLCYFYKSFDIFYVYTVVSTILFQNSKTDKSTSRNPLHKKIIQTGKTSTNFMLIYQIITR